MTCLLFKEIRCFELFLTAKSFAIGYSHNFSFFNFDIDFYLPFYCIIKIPFYCNVNFVIFSQNIMSFNKCSINAQSYGEILDPRTGEPIEITEVINV